MVGCRYLNILLLLVRGRYVILCSCWVVGFEIELIANLAKMRLCTINSHRKNFEQAVSLHSSCHFGIVSERTKKHDSKKMEWRRDFRI